MGAEIGIDRRLIKPFLFNRFLGKAVEKHFVLDVQEMSACLRTESNAYTNGTLKPS